MSEKDLKKTGEVPVNESCRKSVVTNQSQVQDSQPPDFTSSSGQQVTSGNTENINQSSNNSDK
ncbi:hypothetical protein [Ectothiorhodospira shaposhnikovii]|uniref:hypothetical protein n=1 Tax=Ectothiorhodospira shaposhnikovii TaxID=1054 RepID=UPI001904E616|nr:hypothetical protein [Ectothiorhodospira shaposhnikovii]